MPAEAGGGGDAFAGPPLSLELFRCSATVGERWLQQPHVTGDRPPALIARRHSIFKQHVPSCANASAKANITIV